MMIEYGINEENEKKLFILLIDDNQLEIMSDIKLIKILKVK